MDSRVQHLSRSGVRVCRWQTGIDRIKGRVGQRNVPSNPSALYNKALFWDGRSTTLEQHAFLDQDIQTLA
jgi:cytochrome c peroxidase